MAKNRMSDLRDHLFETMEQLKDEDKPMDVERATAIVNVANALIESAKVEVKYLSITDQLPKSQFLDAKPVEERPLLPAARPNGRERHVRA